MNAPERTARRIVQTPSSTAPELPPRVVLDVTRLLSAGGRSTPTGIERVEMAYVEELLARHGAQACFARRAAGTLRLIPAEIFRRYAHQLRECWRQGAAGDVAMRWRDRLRLSRAACLWRSMATPRSRDESDTVWLLLSHANLDRPDLVRGLKHRGAHLVCMLHDLIPCLHPEFSRPREPARHARRLDTMLEHADLVLTNSQTTARTFERYAQQRGRTMPVTVGAPLGVNALRDLLKSPPPSHVDASQPYFVVLGTLEPRKNHLLLLHVWDRLVRRLGSAAPHLLVIGRRGWENEMVLDQLQRNPLLKGKVHELNDVPDCELRPLLTHARALLFPSFDEGYGLPLVEGLALGTPVICSDLPVFRELAGDLPCYLDPLDGLAWLGTIRDYSDADHPERRLRAAWARHWSPPGWPAHFEIFWREVSRMRHRHQTVGKAS